MKKRSLWILIVFAFFVLAVDCMIGCWSASRLYFSLKTYKGNSVEQDTSASYATGEFSNLSALLSSPSAPLYIDETVEGSLSLGNDSSISSSMFKPFIIDFYSFNDSLFHSFPEKKSWENWDRNTYYIQSYILEIDAFLKTAYLNISFPSDKPFSNTWKRVKLNCDESNSAMVSSNNFDLINSSIDIFKMAREKDALFTYCLDENCDVVGRSCILARQEEVNEKP
ncbi:MAG: hypothetical protein WAX66_02620 [Patescibacteria group bacterium]